MKQYTQCALLPHELEAVWKLLEQTPEFTDGVPPARFVELLDTGHIQLWAEPDAETPEAVMVTEIEIRQTGNVVNILSAVVTNNVPRAPLFHRIKYWAARNGCSKLRALCADAQARLFAKDGFQKYATAVELELKDD